MTFSELVNKEYLKTPHNEFYEAVVEALGYEEVKKIIPFSLEQITEAFEKGDKHLNTLRLDKWVYAGGFKDDRRNCQQVFHIRYLDNPMMDLYDKHNITYFSPSEGVSILKMCAKMYYEEECAK